MVDVIAEGWTPERFGRWVVAQDAEVVGLSCTILSLVRRPLSFVAREGRPARHHDGRRWSWRGWGVEGRRAVCLQRGRC